jgi:hypothetical protein
MTAVTVNFNVFIEKMIGKFPNLFSNTDLVIAIINERTNSAVAQSLFSMILG